MKEQSLKPRAGIHALMLCAMLLAASSFPIAGAITTALPPAVLMLLRFLLAATIFAPFAWRKSGGKFPAPAALFRYFLLSVPSVIFFWCMFESLRHTSVINTGALYTLVPAITAFFAFWINKERVGKPRLLGLLLGTLGALWIVFRGDPRALIGLDLNRGDLIFLAGCVFMGMYNPILKKLYRGEPMMVVTFWMLVWGSVSLFALSTPSLGRVEWASIDASIYAGIAYLSVFCTFVTFFLVNYSAVRLGPTRVAAYGFLTPLFVILISVCAGLAPFEPMLIPGILLIALSMGLVQRAASKKD